MAFLRCFKPPNDITDSTVILSGPQSLDNPQPGPSRQEGNIDVSGEKQLNKRLEKFVEIFVKRFEEKLRDFRKEAAVEGTSKPGKTGKIAGPVGAAASGAAGVAVGVPGVAGAGGAGVRVTADIVSGKIHRNKAKKIVEVFRDLEKDDLRKLLVESGGQLFKSFEWQFASAVGANHSWARAMEKLAVDAMDRVINYINRCDEKIPVEASVDLITKGVLLGHSKKGMGATFVPSYMKNLPKMPKSGHTVFIAGKELKTSRLYKKAGVLTIKGDGTVDKYFKKDGCKPAKYGYRLLFHHEAQDYQEEMDHSGVEYRYVLSAEEIKAKLTDILHKINKEDQAALVERVEEGVEYVKQKVDKIHEAVSGQKNTQVKRPVWFNMRSPVKLFTGRVDIMDNLHNQLQNEVKQVVISQTTAITGLGGIGKTELARRYAEKYNENYDNNCVWISSETPDSLRDSFKELASNRLKIPVTEEVDGKKQDRDMKSITEDVYKFFCGVKCLFIFDNAENYRDVRDFLPHSVHPNENKPHILITSRNRDWDVGQDGDITVMQLDGFTPEEAKAFVKDYLSIEDDSQDEDIEKLIEELQYFPLALKQAVVYIQQEGKRLNRRGSEDFTVNDYLEQYQEHKEKLLSKGHCGNNDRYTNTVLTTWRTTLVRIRECKNHGVNAIEILNMMAYFAPDNVDIRKVFSMSKNDKRWEAVDLLDQYSMINLKGGVADIHRMVQEVIRLRLKIENKEEVVLRKFLEMVSKGDIVEECVIHVTSVWNYASRYGKLINDFYFVTNSIYGYNKSAPLHLLSEVGNSKAVLAILEYGKARLSKNQLSKFVEAKDRYSRTPLYIAAECGHLCVLEHLLNYRAEIDSKCSIAYFSVGTKWSSGWTPLHIASFNGFTNIVKIIFDRNNALADIEDSNHRTPAILAATKGYTDIVEYFKPGDNVFFLHTLFRAARLNDDVTHLRNVLKDLEENDQLREIVSVKLGEWAPLHLAAFANWTEIAEILIKNGAEIKAEKSSFTPLHCAANNGNLRVVQLLVDNGADPKDTNRDGWTPLHAAAQHGHLKTVKYFLECLKGERGISVNHVDKKNDTPLHTAAFHGRLKTVAYLLENGADLHAENVLGGTPLLSSTICNFRTVFQFLVNKGANVTGFSNENTLFGKLHLSALHLAAVYDEEVMIKELINKGIDKDVGKDVSLTPLHLAVFFGSSRAFKCLIEKGADINACIKVSMIINALDNAANNSALRDSSMYGVVRRLKGFVNYFADSLRITPMLIDEVCNSSDKRLFSKPHSSFTASILKWIFSLERVRKQIDSLKAYIQQRKNPDADCPIDDVFFTGAGGSIDATDDDGNTPLHLAVRNSDFEVVKYLIGKGADPGVQNKNRETPLKLARELHLQGAQTDDLAEIIRLLNGLK